MAQISDVVTSNTIVQDKSATRSSFVVVGIFAAHTLGPAVRTYDASPSGLSAMIADGFTSGHDAYIKLSAISKQDIKPPKVKVYRRLTVNAQTITLTVTNVAVDYVYRWIVNFGGIATSQSYKVLSGATTTTVATAIAALIDPLAGVAATSSGAVITVTPSTAGTRFMVDTYGAEFTVKDTSADAGIATDLAAGQLLDPNFYGLATDGYSEAEINAAAAWAEANGKVYLALSNDSDVLSSSTTDIASDLKLAGYNRCGVMVSRSQSSQMAVASMARLATEPGSSDANNKVLSGIGDSFSATEQTNAEAKRANMFLAFPGVNATYNMSTGSGRLWDTTRDIDWFDANLAADVFNVLLNNEKVPYNITGKGLVQASVERRGSIAESKGVFNSGTFKVAMPADGADDPADKIAQLLRFTWSAQKQIGIKKVAVGGTVYL